MKDFLTTVLFVGFCIVMPPTIQAALAEPTMRNVTTPCASSVEEIISLVNEGLNIELEKGADSDQYTEGQFFDINDVPFEGSSKLVILRGAKYTGILRTYGEEVCLLVAYRSFTIKELYFPDKVKEALSRNSGRMM